jgi:hypothetical protein
MNQSSSFLRKKAPVADEALADKQAVPASSETPTRPIESLTTYVSPSSPPNLAGLPKPQSGLFPAK